MNRHPLETYSAYLDGRCLSDAEVGALREWIVADPKNAVEFVEFAVLHAAVTERLRLDRLLDDIASHRSGGIAPSLLASAIREIELNSPRVLERAEAETVSEPASSSIWPAAATFGAVAATLLLALWGIWRQGQEMPLPQAVQLRAEAPAKIPEKDEASKATEAPQLAGWLETSFDAKWGGVKPSPAEKLYSGTTISLISGVAQFEMDGGATVVVEGPSEFELTGADGLKLSQGKAAVRVAEQGESFVVDTPTMQVVDLGTEFGVEASPSGLARVMVFDGVVAIGEASDGLASSPVKAAAHAPRLEAGYQVSVHASESVGGGALRTEQLANPRYFWRPDEVAVRLRALGGSVADQRLAEFYGQLRIPGLLAYQPFDMASEGRDLALGQTNAGLVAQGEMEFVQSDSPQESGVLVSGGALFMPLDVSATGPFARHNLLTEGGRIGRTGGELWLSWRTQRIAAAPDENRNSAGFSLMIGDRETADEPLFVGRASGTSQDFLVQSAWGGAAPPHGTVMSEFIDTDKEAAGLQEMQVDDAPHRWIVRIEFREGADRVSVWLDEDPRIVATQTPHAVLDEVNVQFDRLRMAVNREGEVWKFSDLAVTLEASAIAQLEEPTTFRVD